MNLISFCLGDGDGTDCFLTTKPLYPVFLLDCEKEAGVNSFSVLLTSFRFPRRVGACRSVGKDFHGDQF